MALGQANSAVVIHGFLQATTLHQIERDAEDNFELETIFALEGT